MSGNVLEWTSDHYSKDYNSPRNYKDYVIRGGGYLSYDEITRVSNKGFNSSPTRTPLIGFRLAL